MKIIATDAMLAAGALVWREREGQLEVLAVHRPRYNDWSWPKGKLDPGETMPACAVREVAEETRVTIDLGIPLPTLRYPIGGGKIKVVRYWAAQETPFDAPAASAREPVKAASNPSRSDGFVAGIIPHGKASLKTMALEISVLAAFSFIINS